MRVGKGVSFDAPVVFAAQHFAGHVVQHVGGVGAADLRFDLALVAVVDQRLRRGHGGCSVGDLVGEHLMNVWTTFKRCKSSDGLADHAISEINGISARGQVRSSYSHGCREYPSVTESFTIVRPCQPVTRVKHLCVLRVE